MNFINQSIGKLIVEDSLLILTLLLLFYDRLLGFDRIVMGYQQYNSQNSAEYQTKSLNSIVLNIGDGTKNAH